ncbi:AAA family ATPase [uncultured Arcobacter sp.]|uniref:AAA family ATPase n=1 Tax=uncultured Arcobacter sp. TaxID=165434 RepID=UPI00262543B3|nr:AAA family ATPase [uncultured Arcobacter sp.]
MNRSNYEIIEDFLNSDEGFEYVRQLKDVDHTYYSYKDWKVNKHHLECDIFTHTMMVVNNALQDNAPIELVIAGLFHDYGKCFTKELIDDKERAMFKNHWNYSTIACIEYIKLDVFNLSRSQIIEVLRIINNHHLIYQFNSSDNKKKTGRKVYEKFYKSESTLRKIVKFAEYDHYGRITDAPMEIAHDVYEEYIFSHFNTAEETKDKNIHAYKNLVIMNVGLPCSGKSTYTEDFVKHYEYTVHARDNIMRDYYIDNNHMIVKDGYMEVPSYNVIWDSVDHDAVNERCEELYREYITDAKNVIIDETNLSFKTRQKKFNKFPLKYGRVMHVFMTPLSVIKDRNTVRSRTTGKTIPENVYYNMLSSFQIPYDNEYDFINFIW